MMLVLSGTVFWMKHVEYTCIPKSLIIWYMPSAAVADQSLSSTSAASAVGGGQPLLSTATLGLQRVLRFGMGHEGENSTSEESYSGSKLGHRDEQEKKIVEWDLQLSAVVGSRDHCSRTLATDSIGAIAFDPTNEWLATGGMARKIRLYHFDSLVTSVSEEEQEENNGVHTVRSKRYRSAERNYINPNNIVDHNCSAKALICTPAKLSSLKWNPKLGEQVIGCGDYDGVVTEWDIERGLAIFERDEHGGRRVWSIDYSSLNTSLCASASDDGTVQMWDKKANKTVLVIAPPSQRPVCCAEFSPCNPNQIAMACCDHRVYLHDTRYVSSPLLILHHHSKPASYVRFFRENMLVSASIDGSIKLWDIPKSLISGRGNLNAMPVRTFEGHCNAKHFVGLSVWQDGGLLACGSENNEVFAYDHRWGSPLWLHDFDGTHDRLRLRSSNDQSMLLQGGRESSKLRGKDTCSFVSGVCWRQKPFDCTLVAANSDGIVHVLIGKRRKA